MKYKVLTFAALSILSLSINAQQVTPPVDITTNVPVTGFLPLNALAAIWPNVNSSLSNTFNANELVISAAPLWKTATSSGSTPYLSLEGDYFVSKYIGVGAELITLGNGEGNNDIDTMLADFTLRKDLGNLAVYALFSGGYNFNTSEPVGAVGGGISYSYSNKLRWFVDTRISFSGFTGDVKKDQGWMSRIGMSYPF
jgi:hypothetical protein